MSDTAVREVGKNMEGSCWGRWDISEPACSECAIGKRCEERTKKRTSQEEIKENAVEEPSSGGVAEVSPMEFIIGTLGGKYEYTTKENDTAKADYFKKDGKTVIEILTSKKTGKIRIRSSRGVKCLSPIKSIDDAQSALRELPM